LKINYINDTVWFYQRTANLDAVRKCVCKQG
jgi:hypothetical protein